MYRGTHSNKEDRVTALERQLIGMVLGMLLTFVLSLADAAIAGILLSPAMIVAAALWDRVPVAGTSSSTPVTVTSARVDAEPTCSGVFDWDVTDCA